MRHPVAVAACLLLGVTFARGAGWAGETNYDLKHDETKATVGVKGKTNVTIAARPGWHVNEDAPLTMRLDPDPGIVVDKPKLTRVDLAEQSKDKARFEVGFIASEPGRKTINAEASFVMCQATTCMPVKEKIALAVDVTPAKKK
jgi:hypothetical protein